MLIAGPRTTARVRSAGRGVLLPTMAVAILALVAVVVLAAYGSTGAALVTALLVYGAATPLAHAAGLRRRPPLRVEWTAEGTATRLS